MVGLWLTQAVQDGIEGFLIQQVSLLRGEVVGLNLDLGARRKDTMSLEASPARQEAYALDNGTPAPQPLGPDVPHLFQHKAP